MNQCENLPEKILLSQFDSWESYKEFIYSEFKKAFIENKIYFKGKIVEVIKEKYYEKKERGFWHIIGEGETDIDKTVDFNRCSKISWIKYFIEKKESCEEYKVWYQFHDQTKKNRFYIWCKKQKYIIILEDRTTHFVLITAFPITYKRYENKYEKAYSLFKNENAYQ